jgi:hypothetical protein
MDPCWPWLGGYRKQDGRPKKGRSYAYRVIYQNLRGLIPAGMVCHHICANPRCVNPWHIELMNRRQHRSEHHGLYCSRGHLRTEGNRIYGTQCKACTQLRRRLRYERDLNARVIKARA